MSTFRIDCELPDLNTIISESKKGRGQYQPYAIIKNRYTYIVAMSARKSVQRSYDKIDITIHWICRNRKKDKDNIMAGTKFILDGLVAAGIIANDGWKQIGNINHRFSVNMHNPGVEVTLEETK